MKSNNFDTMTSVILITSIMIILAIFNGQLNILQDVSAQKQGLLTSLLSKTANFTSLPSKESNIMSIVNNLFTDSFSNNSSVSDNRTNYISIFKQILNSFKSSMHISINDAMTTAQRSAGNNSIIIAAFIHPERLFIVYDIFTMDSDGNIHRIVVDPGNGKVLDSKQISIMEIKKMLNGSGTKLYDKIMEQSGVGNIGPFEINTSIEINTNFETNTGCLFCSTGKAGPSSGMSK